MFTDSDPLTTSSRNFDDDSSDIKEDGMIRAIS